MNDLSLSTLAGGQTMVSAAAIEALTGQIRGEVLHAGDAAN